MSEKGLSMPMSDGKSPKDEFAASDLRNIINSLGERVVEDLKTQPEHASKNFTDAQVRHEYCRKINGETLVYLVNEYAVPGMIMTMQPLETEKFKLANWRFHSVGIVEYGKNQFAVFDQTNRDGDAGWFFQTGTLEEVSTALDDFFGFHWDLSFVPTDNPKNSVRVKLDNAKQMIENYQRVDYDTHIMFTPSGIETKDVQRPLGLKVLPSSDTPMPPVMRSLMTYGYA